MNGESREARDRRRLRIEAAFGWNAATTKEDALLDVCERLLAVEASLKGSGIPLLKLREEATASVGN